MIMTMVTIETRNKDRLWWSFNVTLQIIIQHLICIVSQWWQFSLTYCLIAHEMSFCYLENKIFVI